QILDVLRQYNIPTNSIKAVQDVIDQEEHNKLDYEEFLEKVTGSKATTFNASHEIKYTVLYLVQEGVRSPDKDYDVLLPIAQQKAAAFIAKNTYALTYRGEIHDPNAEVLQDDVKTVKVVEPKQKKDGRFARALKVFDENVDIVKSRKDMIKLIVDITGVKESSAAVVIYMQSKKRGIKLDK
ncbi:MAG: hypothetical protein ACREAU_01275, partial [Nitrosopumilaceae archaeon]